MRLFAIVLAAGRSTRFGADKLTACLHGGTVLAHTLNAVTRECFSGAVCVVSSDAAEAVCAECGFPCARYAGGPLSESIRTGMESIGDADGVLFINGDQPLLRAESVRALCRAFETDPGAVWRLSYRGEAASPVLFPRSAFDALRSLQGEKGGMAAAKQLGLPVRTSEAGAGQELWDVDTPELLKAAEEYLGNIEE